MRKAKLRALPPTVASYIHNTARFSRNPAFLSRPASSARNPMTSATCITERFAPVSSPAKDASAGPENPVELALHVIGGKWKMPILWRLKDRVWRFNEIRRDLKRVSHKMITQQLRELEQAGLVTRTVHPMVPPHVDYAITELGLSTIPVIEGLRAWGAHYFDTHSADIPQQGRIGRGRKVSPTVVFSRLSAPDRFNAPPGCSRRRCIPRRRF